MFIRALRGKGLIYKARSNVQAVGLCSSGKVRAARYCRELEVSSKIRFVDRLFSQAKDVGMQVTGHPFHVEMVKGTLCRKRFERFIVEDTLYLEGCIKSFELAQLRFPQQKNLFELLIADTKLELDKHKEWQTCFKINSDFNGMNRVSEVYISFLMEVAKHGELVEVIGALWPCYFLFLEMYHIYIKEMEHLTCEHPYYEHVKYYKELLVLQSVEAMKQEVDNLFTNADSMEKTRLKKAFFRFFYNSLEYEKRFFDSVYEIDTRVINAPRVINSIISIRERLLNMPHGSWVLWDLDDTIWISELPLLRSVNNELLEEHIFILESEYPDVRELIWELYYRCDYRLVEEEMIELFADLKERDIHVFGLTKRETGYTSVSGLKKDLPRQDLTLKQLDKLGVSFSLLFPTGEILLKQEIGTSPAILKDGVAFCSGLDKGPILKELLNTARELRIGLPPQIAFFDDLYDNVCEVEEKFQKDYEDGIPVLAIHYRGADSFSDIDQIDYSAFKGLIRALNQND